jgi:ATP-binding cassette subfamily F protein 3
MDRLVHYLELQSEKRVRKAPTITKLDKRIEMRSQAMSATIAMSGAVDLESNTKGQASRVDLAKLAKAEAKLKAKIEKRSRRDLFEGSKLVDMQKKQQSYEEMFMKVNPLDLSGAAKGKSKDIHLPSIDVSFASNKILWVRFGCTMMVTNLPGLELYSLWLMEGDMGELSSVSCILDRTS